MSFVVLHLLKVASWHIHIFNYCHIPRTPHNMKTKTTLYVFVMDDVRTFTTFYDFMLQNYGQFFNELPLNFPLDTFFNIVQIKLRNIFLLELLRLHCVAMLTLISILHLTLLHGSQTCHFHIMMSLCQIPNRIPNEGCTI